MILGFVIYVFVVLGFLGAAYWLIHSSVYHPSARKAHFVVPNVDAPSVRALQPCLGASLFVREAWINALHSRSDVHQLQPFWYCEPWGFHALETHSYTQTDQCPRRLAALSNPTACVQGRAPHFLFFPPFSFAIKPLRSRTP